MLAERPLRVGQQRHVLDGNGWSEDRRREDVPMPLRTVPVEVILRHDS